MTDLICRKSMMRCQTPGMCSPHGGCKTSTLIETNVRYSASSGAIMNDCSQLKRLAEAARIGDKAATTPIAELIGAMDSFRAAANPAAVLELIAEIERLELELQQIGDLAASSRTGPAQAESLRIIEQIAARAYEHREGRLAALERAATAEQERDQFKAENDSLRLDARRWRCVRNAVPMKSPYAVWREGSHLVLGKDADELVDNFLSHAKEASND